MHQLSPTPRARLSLRRASQAGNVEGVLGEAKGIGHVVIDGPGAQERRPKTRRVRASRPRIGQTKDLLQDREAMEAEEAIHLDHAKGAIADQHHAVHRQGQLVPKRSLHQHQGISGREGPALSARHARKKGQPVLDRFPELARQHRQPLPVLDLGGRSGQEPGPSLREGEHPIRGGPKDQRRVGTHPAQLDHPAAVLAPARHVA